MKKKHIDLKPSARLKAICKLEKITQKKLASSVGMSLRGLATILGGKGAVSETLAHAIEAAHGYRHEWILEGEEPKKRNPIHEISPEEKMRLALTDDPTFLPLRELFLRKLIEPVRSRQDKFLWKIEKSKKLDHAYDKSSLKLDELNKELINILMSASDNHLKLTSLMVAGCFRKDWDSMKTELHQYSYLGTQNPSELDEVNELIESLWKLMDELEKLFPLKDERGNSISYRLGEYGITH